MYCCKGYKVSIVSTEAQPYNNCKRSRANLQKKTNEKKSNKRLLLKFMLLIRNFTHLRMSLKKITDKLLAQINGYKTDKNKCTVLLNDLQKMHKNKKASNKVLS